MESNNSNDLKQLQGKKVQINYISPAEEEATVAGRARYERVQDEH